MCAHAQPSYFDRFAKFCDRINNNVCCPVNFRKDVISIKKQE